MSSSRLGKLLSGTKDIAQQVGTEYKRVRNEYKQQQQAHNSQYQPQGYGVYQNGGYQQQQHQASWQQPQCFCENEQQPQQQERHDYTYPSSTSYSPMYQAPPGQQPSQQSHHQYQQPPPPQPYHSSSNSAPPAPHVPQPTASPANNENHLTENASAYPQAEYHNCMDEPRGWRDHLHKQHEEQLRQTQAETQRVKNEQDERLRQMESGMERVKLATSSNCPPAEETTSCSYPPPPPEGTRSYAHPPPPPTPTRPQQQHSPEDTIHGRASSTLESLSTLQPQRSRQKPPSSVPQIQHPSGIVPLTKCINEPLPFELDWFVHAAAPSFLICSRCYVDHIFNTQFRDSFRVTHRPSSPPNQCCFSSRRMKDVLWPMAVSQSSLGAIMPFMQKRQDIAHCPGSDIKKSAKWYATANIPNSTFCPACFEDALSATSFASHFTPVTGIDGYCDASTAYVKRMLDLYAPLGDWQSFCRAANTRLQYPPCEKLNPVPSGSRAWYEATRGPKGMQICVACYCDYFHDTPSQQHWKPLISSQEENRCLMGCINVYFTAERASERKDHDIFWRAMDEWAQQPFCGPQGISGGSWFAVSNTDLLVCGACYSTIVYAYGGQDWFSTSRGNPNTQGTHVCAFSNGHPRFTRNFFAYLESIFRGSPQPLINYADSLVNIRRCPGASEDKADRQYWGWQDLEICEECYVTFAKGTALESRYTLRGVRSSTGCSLYSPRMRLLYNEACSTGNLHDLLAFAQRRKHIWAQTHMKLQMLDMESKFKLQQSHTEVLMANSTKFMGDVQGSHGYLVGNSNVGWFKNEMSYQGVMDLAQAQNKAEQAVGPGVTQDIHTINQMWKDVE